jgi:hypothetical protein
MSKSPIIVGAGLSGLLAAHAWPKASVFEANQAPVENHKAVLRFRGEQVSALTGIPFKKVTVRKGVWADGDFCKPTIQHANMYSRKVLSRLANDRSIWNLDPVERFIAPEDFYFQLIEAVGDRIHWGEKFVFGKEADSPVISTIPMPALFEHGQLIVSDKPSFGFSSIKVQRYRVPDCDLYQTIYFPDDVTNLYRASITGDLLIAESINMGYDCTDLLEEAFGLPKITELTETKQKYGKISAIDEPTRRGIIRLLSEQGIYSLGRFATWRNILLDDLIHDIGRIKMMMDADSYSRRLIKD